jgi:hypothetical protein
VGLTAVPTRVLAQAQESIEIGRLELEDANALLACFRTYLRGARKSGAEARLRACVAGAHGRVTVVTVAAIRRRVRRSEEHGPDAALDEAREALATCATEGRALALRTGPP